MSKFDAEVRELMTRICEKPAMFVGTTDFNLVATFINGFIWGAHVRGVAPFARQSEWDFQRFVVKRYGLGNSVVWNCAYTNMTDWDSLTEREKIDRLGRDYTDFANILTRLVVEIDE